ncbi:MAG: hypothetical protein ACOC1P_00645 [Minisyncoccales bacterium]
MTLKTNINELSSFLGQKQQNTPSGAETPQLEQTPTSNAGFSLNKGTNFIRDLVDLSREINNLANSPIGQLLFKGVEKKAERNGEQELTKGINFGGQNLDTSIFDNAPAEPQKPRQEPIKTQEPQQTPEPQITQETPKETQKTISDAEQEQIKKQEAENLKELNMQKAEALYKALLGGVNAILKQNPEEKIKSLQIELNTSDAKQKIIKELLNVIEK